MYLLDVMVLRTQGVSICHTTDSGYLLMYQFHPWSCVLNTTLYDTG